MDLREAARRRRAHHHRRVDPRRIGRAVHRWRRAARGYLGDPRRTRDRFGTGTRRYHTGDLARRLDNGELQLAHRMDQQIKIDGYRVDLTEVEAVLASVAGVREAVVVPLDGGVSRTLVAMLTPASADVDAVWAQVAECLPRYMMPSTLVAVAVLPLSLAGKADRRAIEVLLREHMGAAGAHDPLDYLCTTVTRWLGRPVDPDAVGLLDLGGGIAQHGSPRGGDRFPVRGPLRPIGGDHGAVAAAPGRPDPTASSLIRRLTSGPRSRGSPRPRPRSLRSPPAARPSTSRRPRVFRGR